MVYKAANLQLKNMLVNEPGTDNNLAEQQMKGEGEGVGLKYLKTQGASMVKGNN